MAVAACLAITGTGSSFAAGGLSDFVVKPTKLSQGSPIKTSNVEDKDIPDWLRKSERLEAMLGDDGKSRVENAKVVSKVETPIPGLDGFVVQADIFNAKSPEGRKELFVFYTDKTKRYLFVGMLIDMEKERDLNMMTERYVRGQLADNPAKALRPQDMHGLVIPGGKTNKMAPLQFVVDLGHENGKSSFLNVVRLHQSLLDGGKNPRPLRIVLVSGGKDEMSTGAMAMAMGYQKISGDGLPKLIEYAEQGRSTPWMNPARLKNDANLKQAMGIGIFQIEDNSSQAMLARLDTLPLIYDGTGDKTKYIMLPTGKADWTQLLTKP
ncbi:hypothetical protein OX89_04235 [Diaphorobacter sp. J5-51]|nr:hypothetical protein OX89_04235 [Diaphorobacter sp. J5-51]